ncbi:trimethylamine methyltransferase family protein [Acetobacterium wieringae]|uniref:Trimethylamine methyltransferase MttB n=1 Tax=Acetobacterium wieringae TaxID=52694 RepID=A0A1F2PI94_9FIRM|nr:trimethylamine methyltransferase family protein [Acetobacterium wieringae]OFV71047.1 trimethylamine methyltransferase MttB [Acetobacterium wieringae]
MKEFNTRFMGARGVSFLTREEMEKIHSCTLELLQEVGVEVQHKGAIELLKKAGCVVNKKRVSMPPGLVEWAIKQAPSRILLYDRGGEFAMDVSGKNSYYGVGSACPNIVDSFTGEIRLCNEEDNRNCVKVADAMPYIDYMMSMAQVYGHQKSSYEHEYAAMIRYSSKPQVVITADLESTKNVVEMASVVRGGMDELVKKPMFILYCEPTSPLVCTKESVEKVMYMAESNLPVLYAPIPMNGATGPMTCAGSLIQANAECLAGLVIAQVTRPGAPFLYGAIITNMDMKSLQPTYASPETMMESLAMSEMGCDFYQLPTWGTAGCTSSKLPDEQAVLEGTQYITLAGLSGANVIHDVGYTAFGLAFSLDLVVMMNDVIGRVRRLFDGINMTPEYLCMQDLKEVGPKGHYLGQTSTRKFNSEMWESEIEDRNEYDRWRDLGSKTMGQRANEMVRNIIENGELNMLPKELDDKVVAILEAADARERELEQQ